MAIGKDKLPDWPPGWSGSISHSDEVAGAVAMPIFGRASTVLGLDVERIVPPGTAQQIASGVMPERSPGGSGRPLAEEITRVFSAKEALYTALFPIFGSSGNFWRQASTGSATGRAIRFGSA